MKIDDSKMNIIKKEESLGLGLKKKNRITKVQFKEKDIRYYSPGQGVNEDSNHARFTQGMNDVSGINNNNNNNDINDNIDTSNKKNYKNYFSNSMSEKNKRITENNKYIPGDQDTIRALKKDSDDNLDSKNKGKSLTMNLGRSYKKEMMSKEEIEKKIINMIHSNLLAKIILNASAFIFSLVFIISFIYNCILNYK